MGRLVMVKCDCGYEYDWFRYGVNSGYDSFKEKLTTRVKAGCYGELWKQIACSDSELHVNQECRLYQCPKCHKISDEIALDLYKTEKQKSYYVPDDEEIVYYYKHMCSDCNKRMKLIPISKVQRYNGNYEDLVICPNCGDVAIACFCGYTD